MSHLNINSLGNKFESIKPIISPNFDIVLVSETKLDEPFQNNQFSISSYRMFRKDRNCFGGGLCIHVKENIAFKQLNSHLDKETEVIYLEINVRLRKWLIVGLYNSPSQFNFLFLENIYKNPSRYLDGYENMKLLGDSDMTPENKNLQHFTDTFSL